jgi:hypothetical protein
LSSKVLKFPEVPSARPSETTAVDTSADLRPWETRRRREHPSRHVNAPGVTASETLAGTLSCLLLVFALLLGGGTRNYLFTDLLVQAFAAGMLVYGLARLRWQALEPGARQLLLLMVLVLAIPLLQLIPLPAFLIQWLPGRGEIYAAREAVGIPTPTFLAWSLDPNATLASLRALLPAAALLLLGVQLSPAWRLRFLAIIIAAALLMVALGLIQIQQGTQSELRFYRPTNTSQAVGQFANANHYASMLVIALIGTFCGVIFHSSVDHRRLRRVLQMLGWLLMGAILLLGIFLSASRAAVMLAVLMSSLMLILALANRKRHRNAFRWLPMIVLAAGLIGIEFGLNKVTPEFENLGDRLRENAIPVVVSLTKHFGGLGTGVGSFPAVYEAYEPVEYLGTRIVNHAHNDWAELWIDAGFLALVMVILFGRWVWQRACELLDDWSSGRPENSQRLAGILVILSLCLHSLLDYPLRTTALSSVFAIACILYLRLPSASARSAELPAENRPT